MPIDTIGMSEEIDLGVVHHFSDGLYAKRMNLPAGSVAVTHSHRYDHLSILATGRVVLTTNGTPTEYIAPACINICAGVHHQIESLEPSVWFCIHASDGTDAENIDEPHLGK